MAGHTVGKVQRNSNVRSLKGSWHISCGLIGSTVWSIATWLRQEFPLAEGLISRNGFLPRTPLFLEIFLEISLFPDYSLAAEAQNIHSARMFLGV